MSNILPVSPGELTYCPRCADVFGTLEGRSKRCGCQRSRHLTPPAGGDFPTPFEICWYCQSEIIRSGSRWAAYYCATCRPKVLALADRLDAEGLVPPPVGRHSIQGARWRNSRPFTAGTVVHGWCRARLRRFWALARLQSEDWVAFANAIKALAPEPDLEEIGALVQSSREDFIDAEIRKLNRRLHGCR